MKYYKNIDYFLFFMDFPHMGVPGAVAGNSDATVNIYINTLYTPEIQKRTVKHELRHLVKNHFQCDWMTIEEKELEAEKKIFGKDFAYWKPTMLIIQIACSLMISHTWNTSEKSANRKPVCLNPGCCLVRSIGRCSAPTPCRMM